MCNNKRNVRRTFIDGMMRGDSLVKPNHIDVLNLFRSGLPLNLNEYLAFRWPKIQCFKVGLY